MEPVLEREGEEEMSKPLSWPYDAQEHRDRSAEEVDAARRHLANVLADGKLTPDELPEVAMALGHVGCAELHLVHVGARIEPA